MLINKIDLYNEEELEYAKALQTLYETIGYPTFMVSAIDTDSLRNIKEFLKGKTTLVSGNSGVGKSTLINSLLPEPLANTAEISYYHNRGVHTTTFSEMYWLRTGVSLLIRLVSKGLGLSTWKKMKSVIILKRYSKRQKNVVLRIASISMNLIVLFWKLSKSSISTSRYHSYLSMMSDLTSGNTGKIQIFILYLQSTNTPSTWKIPN